LNELLGLGYFVMSPDFSRLFSYSILDGLPFSTPISCLKILIEGRNSTEGVVISTFFS
jgi:hypothetical protein